LTLINKKVVYDRFDFNNHLSCSDTGLSNQANFCVQSLNPPDLALLGKYHFI
jgi:hypothetical protein